MVNAEKLITDHLPLWSSTIKARKSVGRGSRKKRVLYGVKKLRELILKLAVQGLLVPQDPNDEPASKLLIRIAEEKIKSAGEGKIKKLKPQLVVSDDETPNYIPTGWECTKVGSLFDVVYGKGLPNSKLTETGFKVFGANGIIGHYTEYLYEDTQLLVSCRGAYSGKPNISPKMCYVTSNSLVLKNSWENLVLKYFYYALTSADKSKIVTGSAQPQVTTTNLDPFIVLLPPLAEQHRIVAKVDELMALCDKLEQQQEDSIETHETLVKTLLDALTTTSDPAQFQQAWQRIEANFNLLFTTESSVDHLKQTILQLAVMGKLVPQDPNDEPASQLLKKIATEKEQLIKDKKIKKQKALPPIDDKEQPFVRPQNWSWVRLEEICELITKGSSPKWQGVSYTENPEDVLFVTSENVGSNELLLTTEKYVETNFNKVSPRSVLNKNDILMNIVGASIGRTAIFDIDRMANINQAVCLIRTVEMGASREFLLKFFNSNTCISYMYDKQVDNARANLSMGNIAKFVVPFPPIAEQQRIVAKVDSLMTLCDTLKAKLQTAQTTQLTLTDTIVEQAVIN